MSHLRMPQTSKRQFLQRRSSVCFRIVIHCLLANCGVGNTHIQTALPSFPLNADVNGNISSLPDGIYPDYSQACRMFSVVSKGQRKIFWCTRGFVFSEALGRCEPPDRTVCTGSNGADHLTSPCPIENGVYPDYSSGCSSFYICKGGKRTAVPCPAQTLFDWKTKSCRPAHDVLCNPLTCRDRKDGYYADAESGCRRYVECRLNKTTEHICPEAMIFNERTVRCSSAERTRCTITDYTQCLGVPDGYYLDYQSGCKSFGLCLNGKLKTFNCPLLTVFNPTSLTCEPSAKCNKPVSGKCVNMTNGIHPDFDSECKDFFVCVDGIATHFGSCPQGKILNPVTGTCQPKSLVICSPVKDPDCDGYQDGIYPDYGTGCSAYYTCLGERRISTSYCTGHNLFDISTGKCLPSSFVLCRRSSEVRFISRPLDSYRCEGRIGIFPDFASRCKHYVVCAYGYQKWYSCPEGKWFDVETETCSSKEPDSCLAPSVVATFQCLPADEGIYSSSKCTQWHECWRGVGFTITCPMGQMYDIIKGRCVSGNCTGIAKNFQMQSFAFGLVRQLSNRNYDCTAKEDGIHTDENCRVFHICMQGNALSFTCPKKFVFERESNLCVIGLKNFSQCNFEDEDTTAAIFSCDSHEDGMYSDTATDCRRYFVCEAGKMVTVYCPEKQKFSSVKMVCDEESKVTCSGIEGDRNTSKSDSINTSNNTGHYRNVSQVFYKDERDYVDHLVTSGEAKSFFTYFELKDEKQESASRSNRTFSPNLIPNIFTSKRQHSLKYIPTQTATEVYLSTDDSNATEVWSKENYSVPSSENFTSLDPVESVTSENVNQTSICPSGDTGFYADYDSGCKKFHICFRTIRKTYSCPSVLLFNPDSKNCDLPDNVHCSKPEPLEDDIFDCKGRRNQYFADITSGCRQYIGCLGHSPFRFTCPPGKLFSSVSGSCEPEVTTQCEERNSYSSNVSSRRLNGSSVLKHVHGIPARFFFDCEDKADGFYPDYVRHCHVFYRCVRGKKFSHYCKQGMLFNPISGICDFEENVVCSSNNGTQAVSVHF